MSDASDADRLEQQREVEAPEEPAPISHDPEVSEADAVEQAQPAPIDDDEMR